LSKLFLHFFLKIFLSYTLTQVGPKIFVNWAAAEHVIPIIMQ